MTRHGRFLAAASDSDANPKRPNAASLLSGFGGDVIIRRPFVLNNTKMTMKMTMQMHVSRTISARFDAFDVVTAHLPF